MLEQGSTVYWIIVASFVMPVLLSIGLVWFFIGFQKRKHKMETMKKDALLREQSLLLEKQKALTAERTRIAGEMHDDLGGGLTTIKFLSQNLQRKIPDEAHKTQLDKIVNHSQSLVNNMSEIIWAMNAGFDTLLNLTAYSRRFAYEFLEPYGIELSFDVIGDIKDVELTGEKRRNLFLVIKEALHNTAKHSQANKAKITFAYKEDTIHLTISDDGIGFQNDKNQFGNGLKNIRLRIEEMGGTIEVKGDKGVEYLIKLPI